MVKIDELEIKKFEKDYGDNTINLIMKYFGNDKAVVYSFGSADYGGTNGVRCINVREKLSLAKLVENFDLNIAFLFLRKDHFDEKDAKNFSEEYKGISNNRLKWYI